MSRQLGRPRYGPLLLKARHLLLAGGVTVLIVLMVLAGSRTTDLQRRLGFDGTPAQLLLGVAGLVATAVVCAALYRFAPRDGLRWSAAAAGAAPAAVGLVATPAFAASYLAWTAGTTPVRVFLVLAGVLVTCYLTGVGLLVGAAIAVRRERRLAVSVAGHHPIWRRRSTRPVRLCRWTAPCGSAPPSTPRPGAPRGEQADDRRARGPRPRGARGPAVAATAGGSRRRPGRPGRPARGAGAHPRSRSSCRSGTGGCWSRRSPTSAAPRRRWRPTRARRRTRAWTCSSAATRTCRTSVSSGRPSAARLRRQRLRRDAPGPVGVGRQAAGREPRGRRARERVRVARARDRIVPARVALVPRDDARVRRRADARRSGTRAWTWTSSLPRFQAIAATPNATPRGLARRSTKARAQGQPCRRSTKLCHWSTASRGSSATRRSSSRSRSSSTALEDARLLERHRARCSALPARRCRPTGATCSSSTGSSHLARKVVGVGSVGTRGWILLLRRPRRRRPAVPPGQGGRALGARAVHRRRAGSRTTASASSPASA